MKKTTNRQGEKPDICIPLVNISSYNETQIKYNTTSLTR